MLLGRSTVAGQGRQGPGDGDAWYEHTQRVALQPRWTCTAQHPLGHTQLPSAMDSHGLLSSLPSLRPAAAPLVL